MLPSSSGDDEEVSCLVKAFSMVKELLISVDQQVHMQFMYNKGWNRAEFELRNHQVIMTLILFDRWKIWRKPSG